MVSWGESPLFNSRGEEILGGILLSFLLAGRKRLGTQAGPGAFTPLIVSTWERVSRTVVTLPVSISADILCLDQLFSVFVLGFNQQFHNFGKDLTVALQTVSGMMVSNEGSKLLTVRRSHNYVQVIIK